MAGAGFFLSSLAAASGRAVSVVGNPTPPALTVTRPPVLERTARFKAEDANDIVFSSLPRTSGLTQSRVQQIVQDDQGFMWFGTQYGLDRFDGYNVKVFKPGPGENSIGGSYIHALFKDRDGCLWIGSDEYLDRFDPKTETFTHFQLMPQQSGELPPVVIAIAQDPQGQLWIGTARGLFRLDPVSGRTTQYLHEEGNADSLSSNTIKYLGTDRRGIFWVVTDEGLDAFDRMTNRVSQHISLHEPGDMAFHEDQSGTFWIYHSSGTGLAIYDRESNTLTNCSLSGDTVSHPFQSEIFAATEDKSGAMWFGTVSEGLLKFDRGTHSFTRYRHYPDDPQSVAGDSVVALYSDREGNIWVSLHGLQLNVFANPQSGFHRLPSSPAWRSGRGETIVNAIFEDSRNVLWLSYVGTLVGTDDLTKQPVYYGRQFRTRAPTIDAMAEDALGGLWVATVGAGLSRMDRSTGKIVTYRHHPGDPTSLSSDLVSHILIDKSGVLWATTYDGLVRFNAREHSFTAFRPFSPYAISDLAQDQQGNFWISSASFGLQRFDPTTGEFTTYRHEANNDRSLSNNRVNSVFIDHAGHIWAATQSGLDKLDPKSGRFTNYFERDGLRGVAGCMLEDDQGHLWMSTTSGISEYDPARNLFNNFTVADGLPGADMTGWGACSRSPSGEMFIGGFSGAVRFWPNEVTKRTNAPPVVLTSFEISGTPINPGDGSPLTRAISYSTDIRLSHGQPDFSIEFSALSFSAPEANRYRYMLEGFEPSWHLVPSDRRIASFTALPTGSYRFVVQGATSHGEWSEPGASLRITILGPWWKATWLRAVLLLLLGLMTVIVYFARVRQLAAQFNMRLEERVGERTRIARELHDSLFQGFQALVIHLQAARDMLPQRPTDAAQAMEVALERGDEALAEARAAVEDLRAEALVQVSLVASLKQLWSELTVETAVVELPQFRLVIEGKARALDSIIHDEVYRIAREALRNSLKHAASRNLEAELSFGKVAFTLRIRDDGVGIAPQVYQEGQRRGHWGLPGMRERAQRFGGHLRIWSERDAGTEIELEVPARVAYHASLH